METYCLVEDDSCHWYVIPYIKKGLWYEFLDSEDCENGNVPEWADELDGGPGNLVFTNYTK